MNQKLIIPAALMVLGASVITIAPNVMAFGGADQATFVTQLANKLGISEDQVSTALDEIREEHQAEREAEFTAKLDEAVAAGEITSEQKDLILQKHDEMKANRPQRDDWQDLTPEERRTQMEQKRAELESWAEDNDIELKYFGPQEGRRGEGRGEKMGRGPMNFEFEAEE